VTGLPGAECRQVAVEGVRLRVYRAGPQAVSLGAAGRPVLLLHGIPQTAAVWRSLLPALAADRVVVAPDLKGLGGSEVAGPYDVPTLVRELAALALHEVDGEFDLVGHDWGGSLALALAATRPDLVRRVVVINAPYRYIDYRRAAYIPFFALPAVPELAFALGGRDLVRRMIRHAWCTDPPLDRETLEHYAAAYTDPARISAMLGYYRAAVRGRLRTVPGQLRRRAAGRRRPVEETRLRSPERTLVLWGAADPVLPVSVGEAVVRDLGADVELVSLPGVGHFVPEEAPGLAREIIEAFLTSG
jgi:pimeloyl-ACP methyl ester carboxylesterase